MLQYKDHREKLELLKNSQLSLKENVEFFLERIEKNKDINAFNFVFEDALNYAEKVEDKIKQGNGGKCAGMVIAIKDVLALKDKPLTCSSKILNKLNSIYTATAVQKLIDEDAIIIGKTNCDEFAMGSSNENSAFGPVLNPVDKERVPGGSSGGSAAAVAAGLCDAALGTDTGGSIRQPASFTGTIGLKPTYGRVSRYGLTAYGSSFDCIGPITNNIYDTAILTDILSGYDPNDSTSIKREYDYLLNYNEQSTKLKIGIPKDFLKEGIDEEVKNSFDKSVEELKRLGNEIIDISLPLSEYTIATYYILVSAEASSNLSRYDGVRFGYRSDSTRSLQDLYEVSRTEGFGKEVKRRIMLGTYVLSSGYYDAYYRKAQQVRRLIKEDFDKAFEQVDLILTPTAPTAAYKLEEKTSDPLQMYLGDIFTVSANLCGNPAISFPVKNATGKLPIGIQFTANHFEESKLLQMCTMLL